MAPGRKPDPRDVRRLSSMFTKGLQRHSWRELPRDKKTAGLKLADDIAAEVEKSLARGVSRDTCLESLKGGDQR